MYGAYIRSVFDYASPVRYPLMSATNLQKVQVLQNKALRKILGVPCPLSTRIEDLHHKANITPLAVRYQAATAYQAEKYHRHPTNDPLNSLARAAPSRRLKQRTWQHVSDEIFYDITIDPSCTSLLSSSPLSTNNTNSAPLHFEMNENHTFIPIPPPNADSLISL